MASVNSYNDLLAALDAGSKDTSSPKPVVTGGSIQAIGTPSGETITVSGKPSTSLLGAIGRGLLNGVSAGFADEGLDGLHKLIPAIPNGDQLRDYESQDEVNHPYAKIGGELAGGALSSAVPGLGEAALGKLALQGALSGVGNSNITSSDGSISKSLEDAAFGALGSALVGKSLSGIGGLARNYANTGAVTSVSRTPFELAQSSNPIKSYIGNAVLNSMKGDPEALRAAQAYRDNAILSFENRAPGRLGIDTTNGTVISQNPVEALRNNSIFEKPGVMDIGDYETSIAKRDNIPLVNRPTAQLQNIDDIKNADLNDLLGADVYNPVLRDQINQSGYVNELRGLEKLGRQVDAVGSERTPTDQAASDILPLAGIAAGHAGIGAAVYALQHLKGIADPIARNYAIATMDKALRTGRGFNEAVPDTTAGNVINTGRNAAGVGASRLDYSINNDHSQDQTIQMLRDMGWSDAKISQYLNG